MLRHFLVAELVLFGDELSLLIKQANPEMAFDSITADTPDALQLVLHVRVYFGWRYGPQTDPIRKALQRYTELKLEDLFPAKANGTRDVDSPTTARGTPNARSTPRKIPKIIAIRRPSTAKIW